jgi:hypothetical protein
VPLPFTVVVTAAQTVDPLAKELWEVAVHAGGDPLVVRVSMLAVASVESVKATVAFSPPAPVAVTS